MDYKLFLDDERNPEYLTESGCWELEDVKDFIVCRSTEEAKAYVQANGMPEYMALDHDLGGMDTTMIFLHWLAESYWDGQSPIPVYGVHSSNPCGTKNIIAYMESWRKSCKLSR